MHYVCRGRLLCLLLGLAVLAHALVPLAGGAKANPEPTREERLSGAARVYRKFGRVDGDTRWSPALCRPPFPALAHFSASEEEATHGRKLYSAFAKHRESYLSFADREQPTGQIIVKEAWHPELVTDAAEKPTAVFTKPPGYRGRWDREADGREKAQPDASRTAELSSPTDEFPDYYVPYATRDGKLYRVGTKAGLFVMMKLAPNTPETDRGWLYGTVASDGKTVTAAGRVTACMRCHERAEHDRVYGLPKPEEN